MSGQMSGNSLRHGWTTSGCLLVENYRSYELSWKVWGRRQIGGAGMVGNARGDKGPELRVTEYLLFPAFHIFHLVIASTSEKTCTRPCLLKTAANLENHF
jgi:hypothetical protein